AALARAEAAVEALEDEKQRARDEIAKLREGAGTLLAERRRLEQGLEEARLRDVEARTQVAELERQIGALREQRQADAAEREAARARRGRRRPERTAAEGAGLSMALAAVQAERDYFAAEEAAADAAHARLEEALVREAARRVTGAAPVAAPVAAATAQRQPGLGPAHVVGVAADPAWAAAAGEGRRVTVMRAGDAALESLGGT